MTRDEFNAVHRLVTDILDMNLETVQFTKFYRIIDTLQENKQEYLEDLMSDLKDYGVEMEFENE